MGIALAREDSDFGKIRQQHNLNTAHFYYKRASLITDIGHVVEVLKKIIITRIHITLTLNLLNFLNGIIHLPYLELFIIIIIYIYILGISR